MSNEYKIIIPKHTDEVVVKAFQEVAKLLSVFDASLRLLASPTTEAVKLNEPTALLKQILAKKTSIIQHLSVNGNGFNIAFFRGGKVEGSINRAIYDEVVVTVSNHQRMDREKFIDSVTLLNRSLKATSLGRSVGGKGKEQAELEDIHVSVLERLEKLNEKLIEETHNYRETLSKEASDYEKKVLENFEAKRQELEDEYREKEEKLKDEEKKLEARRSELDDKDNTHARRELRKNIINEIKKRQENFSLTAGTNKMRKPILIAMSCLIGFFVVLAFFNLNEVFRALDGSDYNKILLVTVKQTLYVTGAVGALIFMIRWMNRWFELHTKAEFDLKQFELDMERASWLVETSLEWKDAKGNAIPSELLESLSRSLFVKDGEQVEKLQDPADQLASAILGSSSSIKLKAGDSVLDVNPSKLIKAQKKAEADSEKE